MKPLFRAGLPLASFLLVATTLMVSDPALNPAHAATLTFENISSNTVLAPKVGDQLSVDVTAKGATEVVFTFKNSGPIDSSIADIYFANEPLLFQKNTMTIENQPGLKFSEGATPENLPGGKNVKFAAVFSADSDAKGGITENGINPGESLAIVLALAGGSDFDDVLNALTGGALRLGLHVQAIDGGGSDSYVTVAHAPLPGALPLFATGLGALGFWRWLSKRKLTITA